FISALCGFLTLVHPCNKPTEIHTNANKLFLIIFPSIRKKVQKIYLSIPAEKILTNNARR
ncbi:hypothetical protein, partial [Klebsiella pneumoniae]|uniref:hypothetical protein n=1 Tax=Klebsiella pneumoniae TaxID=573 RepID=UPI001C6FA16E